MKFANYGTTRRLYLHSLAFGTVSVSYYVFFWGGYVPVKISADLSHC